MSGPIVGHDGPDRRACRVRSSGMSARSSGMSGPIVGHVGHVGPDFGRSSGRRLSEIALLGFHSFLILAIATRYFYVAGRYEFISMRSFVFS